MRDSILPFKSVRRIAVGLGRDAAANYLDAQYTLVASSRQAPRSTTRPARLASR